MESRSILPSLTPPPKTHTSQTKQSVYMQRRAGIAKAKYQSQTPAASWPPPPPQRIHQGRPKYTSSSTTSLSSIPNSHPTLVQSRNHHLGLLKRTIAAVGPRKQRTVLVHIQDDLEEEDMAIQILAPVGDRWSELRKGVVCRPVKGKL